jgi:A/G-specific adenine glycosylase
MRGVIPCRVAKLLVEALISWSSPMIGRTMQKQLLTWYDHNKRDLPWRDRSAPNLAYRVWTSEIMLQQTKVDTVIRYFNKWMVKFPTPEDLSKATLEEVHEQWAGLGFYRRGTNFHKAAKELVDGFGGVLPKETSKLIKLPGIGPYTAGAISSIAYGEVDPVVDGNVMRVFARMYLIDKDIKDVKSQKEFWSIATKLMDEERPGDYNQSLMELGALICTPKSPKCGSCPISSHCKGFEAVSTKKLATVEIYPVKSKTQKRDDSIGVILLKCDGNWLMRKRPDTGLLASLWEFPNFQVESEDDGKTEISEFLESLDYFSDDLTYVGEIQHIFTHIKQQLHIYKLDVSSEKLPEGEYKWIPNTDIDDLAISTQMKKVYQKVKVQKNDLTKYFKKKK